MVEGLRKGNGRYLDIIMDVVSLQGVIQRSLQTSSSKVSTPVSEGTSKEGLKGDLYELLHLWLSQD